LALVALVAQQGLDCNRVLVVVMAEQQHSDPALLFMVHLPEVLEAVAVAVALLLVDEAGGRL
jgi:hypothetical protein